jgi:hypothetical protein
MNRKKLLLTACCALGLCVPHGWSQPPKPEPPKVDLGKKLLEMNPKRVVAATAPAPREVSAEPKNPAVEPGKVKWHQTLADAQAAAEKSGRPVLVFHMMGQLDRQFC